jgi:choline dehydrogenase
MGEKHNLRRIFDYVIIGAGSAGGIIAKELTDDRKTSVLVLEAGTNMPNISPSIADADVFANDNRVHLIRLPGPRKTLAVNPG